MLSIGDQTDAREFQDAVTQVRQKLDSALEDPAFRDYLLARSRRMPLPTISEEYLELHAAAILVGNTFEELGILVKNNIIDRNIFLDRYAWKSQVRGMPCAGRLRGFVPLAATIAFGRILNI